MGSTTVNKMSPMQPGEYLDYDFDWTSWLDARDDTIDSATVVCVDAGVTLGTLTVGPKVVKQWVTAVANSASNKLTCLLVTVGGRRAEVDMIIKVQER